MSPAGITRREMGDLSIVLSKDRRGDIRVGTSARPMGDQAAILSEIARPHDQGLDQTWSQETQKRVENRLVERKWVKILDRGSGGSGLDL